MENKEITPHPNTTKIKHRFVTCLQSSGRIGKSTVMEGIMTWADFAGVPYAAVDCDADPALIENKVFRPGDKAARQTPKKFNPLAFIHE